jgi:hypothetical protein
MTCTCGHAFADHHESGFGVECMGEACKCAAFREAPIARECVWCSPRHLITDGTRPASSGMCPDAVARFDAQARQHAHRHQHLIDRLEEPVGGGGHADLLDAYRRAYEGGMSLLGLSKRQDGLDVRGGR